MSKYYKRFDIFLNVIVPLSVGSFSYFISTYTWVNPFLKSYLADACWAYSFASAIIIIWNRKLKYSWLSMAFFISCLFELFQYKHLIAGTGDIYDVLTYFIFFLLAIISNNFFKLIFYKNQTVYA